MKNDSWRPPSSTTLFSVSLPFLWRPLDCQRQYTGLNSEMVRSGTTLLAVLQSDLLEGSQLLSKYNEICTCMLWHDKIATEGDLISQKVLFVKVFFKEELHSRNVEDVA